MRPTVDVFLFSAEPEEHKVVERIMKFMNNLLKDRMDFTYRITDLKYKEPPAPEERAHELISFGDRAADNAPDWTTRLPPPLYLLIGNQNTETRKQVLEDIQRLARNIYTDYENEVHKPDAHVETPAGVTVGQTACDIEITPEELEYLKELRKLLDGSKIVIIKGDIRIEVE